MSAGAAVALLSGGMDSLVSLAEALARHNHVRALFLDYGQRARVPEHNAAHAIASHYDIAIDVVDISWLADLAPQGMRAGQSGDVNTVDQVWIPNRNGVFLNVAGAFAESSGIEWVVTGFNLEEASEFPDNSGDYINAVNQAWRFSTRDGVKVASYTIAMTKAEILARGAELRAPLDLLWSCYRAGDLMCGTCGSCVRLVAALATLPDNDRPNLEFADG